MLFLAAFCVQGIFANPVSEKTAEKVAINFFSYLTKVRYNGDHITRCITGKYNNRDAYYIFHFDTKGFVIVSADDAVIPVLGYSFEGQPEDAQIPAALTEFLEAYSLQIDKAAGLKKVNEEAAKEWKNFLNNNMPKDIAPLQGLIATKWGQVYPYNKFCPYDTESIYNNRCPAGCTPVAMAQVMKYHEWPEDHGQGTSSYTHPEYGYLYVNHSTTLHWDLMPTVLTPAYPSTYVNPVATLIYHCGVSGHTSYSPTGSGMYLSAAANAMEDHYYYEDCACIYRNSTPYSQWKSIIKSELDDYKPLIYAGGSHAFVVDGYKDGKDTRFHINWGWSGAYDGWFILNDLTPGSYNFNASQKYVTYSLGSTKSNSMNISDNISLSGNLNLYPNPNTGIFRINIPDDSGVYNINIMDITGKTVYLQSDISGTTTIDLSDMVPGIYMVKVYNDTEFEIRKIIIQ